MINFKSIPFLKIIFPYILGICFVFRFGILNQSHFYFFITTVFLVVTFLFQKYYKPVFYFKKGLFIFILNTFLFLLAQETCFLYNETNNSNHYSKHLNQSTQSAIATVTDLPLRTEKYTKLNVQVTQIEENKTWHYCIGKTIIYLKNDSTKSVDLGDVVFFTSKFSYVNEPKNPNEFNYKRFLENKNVFHVVYLSGKQLSGLKNQPQDFSLSLFGTRIKQKVVNTLKESGLDKNAFSICAALLVGYDDEIDKEVMQSFSHSGTLHVLSVSGMHTGVLYGVLLFLFKLFDKHDKRKKLKCAVVIVCLIAFVFITGFSPSALRAALMLSLVIIGQTFYKQGNSYNTLLLSAFLLLIINPFLLIDVGFLLSYLAVFGIMYLYPILNTLYFFENKIARWFWSMVLMSVAATVFTLPVSLYYFHQFPLWFIVSNIVIIPLSIGLMAGAFCLLIFFKIGFFKNALVYLINGVAKSMLWVAQLTNNESYGYIDHIAFSEVDVVFLFLTLYALLVFIYSKQYKHIVLLGCISITWLFNSVVINYQEHKKKELIVFHVKGKQAFVVRVGKKVYTSCDSITESDYQRFVKPYLFTIPNVSTQKIEQEAFKISQTIVSQNQAQTLKSINTNYVIVSNNTPLTINKNDKIKQFVIADCSNSYSFVKELKKQCVKNGVLFYSVKESGALQLALH